MNCDYAQWTFYNGALEKLFTTTNIVSARIRRRLNKVGKMTLEVPSSCTQLTFDVATTRDLGCLVEVAETTGKPVETLLQTFWFLEKVRQTDDESDSLFKMTFADSIDLLDRRIVSYRSNPVADGTSRTFMAGLTASEMARILEGLIGPTADPELVLDPYLVVDPISFASPQITKNVAFRKVMNYLTQSADASAFNGVPLYFDVLVSITATGTPQFNFHIYKNQRGTDKTDLTVRTTDPLFKLDFFEIRFDLPNVAIVSGSGRETDRKRVIVEALPYAKSSIFSRREVFKFSTSWSESVLRAEGEALVAKASGGVQLSGQLLGSLANVFDYGDRLTIEHEGTPYDCIVSGINIDIERQEFEKTLTIQSLS